MEAGQHLRKRRESKGGGRVLKQGQVHLIHVNRTVTSGVGLVERWDLPKMGSDSTTSVRFWPN